MKNTIDKILIVFVFIVLCFDYDVKIKTFYDITKLFCCYFLIFYGGYPPVEDHANSIGMKMLEKGT